MQNRRTFLQILGTGVGAALLPACGDSGGGGQNMEVLPSPNGYQLSPIVSPGDALPGGGTVKELLGHYQWLAPASGKPSLVFQAVDDQGKTGLYEFFVDLSGGAAKVSSPRAILRQGSTMTDAGDTVPNGRSASRHTVWDANSAGSTLIVIESDGRPPAVYLERGRGGFKHLFSQNVPVAGHKFAARLGHVRLGDNHDLLAVAGYHPGGGGKRGGRTRMGLFHIPGAEMAKATLLLATGDPVTGGTIAHIGLPELGPNNTYAIQLGVREGSGSIVSRVFTGVVGDDLSLQAQQTAGERAFFHARLDAKGNLGQVVHLSDADMQLRFQGKTLLKTGDQSPAGNKVLSIDPPVFGQGSTLFAALGTDGPMELALWNGSAWKTVLAAMDGIDGKAVQKFLFGTFPRQADAMNRFVALIDFGDKDGQSIMLATPV